MRSREGSRPPAAAALVAIAALAIADATAAQEIRNVPADTINGAFTAESSSNSHQGFSVVEPPDGLSESRRGTAEDGSGRWFFRSWGSVSSADSTQSLYDRAQKALKAGNATRAQRLFEQLVADAPGSKLASDARLHLGRLYRAQAAAESESADGAAPRNGAVSWSNERDIAAKPASLDVAVSVLPRSVLMQARVSHAVDEEFLAAAGDRVFFGAGSSVLGMRAQSVVDAQARFLMRRPDLAAVVEGHADDGPVPEEETVRLSEERAQAVRNRLIAAGVTAERLTAYGRGREDRVADCSAPECLAQNRRAITILLDGNRRVGHGPTQHVRGVSDKPSR